jgi:hypothetical protein
MDTQHERHVSLVKAVRIDPTRFFHLTLDDYMKAQHRSWKLANRPTPDYQEMIKRWVELARSLARNADAMELLSIVRDKKPSDLLTFPAHTSWTPCLQQAIDLGLLDVKQATARTLTAHFVSIEAAAFLGTGDWLEFYVWHAAVSRGLADEQHCQWGCAILDGEVEKELDLALMHKAQLIIAECKAEQNPFQAKKGHLHKLQAKANVLGGSYVCKLFITNQRAVGDSYQAFENQAKQYKIVVVTGEHLPDIGQILEKEATRPTYQRI